jgi:hypothetical protein
LSGDTLFTWQKVLISEFLMRHLLALQVIATVLGVSTQVAFAQNARWHTYNIPETGTSVDVPVSIFTEQAGLPLQGYGERLKSADGRADLTIYAETVAPNVSPADFLAKMNPPAHIQYKRITSRFFAVSSNKDDKVWYNRCNFSNGFVHCVLINYPAAEEHAWDDIVTRISLSLRGR